MIQGGLDQGDGFPRCMLVMRFRESPTSKYYIMHMKPGSLPMFSLSVTTSQAMSISSMEISIMYCIPNAGVGTAFNGKLFTIRRMTMGGMTSSASQTFDATSDQLGPINATLIYEMIKIM